MKKFHFEVSDGFFPQKFSAIFEGNTQQEAETECREWYAHELGTSEDELTVELIRIKS